MAETHYYYTIQEVAVLVRYSEDTIRRAIQNQRLGATRQGSRRWLISEPSLKSWIQQGMPTAPKESTDDSAVTSTATHSGV